MNVVYLGWDSREPDTYEVARHSILSRTTGVVVKPLKLAELGWVLKRPLERRNGKLWCPISDAPMSTEFAISRFCVPFLQRIKRAVFADSDIVCHADINELFALADDRFAVQVVKHRQDSGPASKMDGQQQLYYARKNWSSVVLWNCTHFSNYNLTLHRLNHWPGRDLHAFKWLKDEEIGGLPLEWNWLVGVSPKPAAEPKLYHFTLGTPNIIGYEACDCSNVWKEEYANCQRTGTIRAED